MCLLHKNCEHIISPWVRYPEDSEGEESPMMVPSLRGMNLKDEHRNENNSMFSSC